MASKRFKIYIRWCSSCGKKFETKTRKQRKKWRKCTPCKKEEGIITGKGNCTKERWKNIREGKF